MTQIVKLITADQGKFNTTLSLEEARTAVATALKTGKELELPLLGQNGRIGNDFVTVDTVRYLDLSKLEIIGFEVENQYSEENLNEEDNTGDED
tara:strand:- start:147 stop:428 length:282 start_codon:yes stop_codon:yes gene_type:complete